MKKKSTKNNHRLEMRLTPLDEDNIKLIEKQYPHLKRASIIRMLILDAAREIKRIETEEGSTY